MRRWYEIKAAADESAAEIFIFDEIGFFGLTARDFIEELKPLAGRDLVVRINSPGGAVFDGLAIHNALARHTGEVTVTVEGIAASIASVIAMAGDQVIMPANTLMMIHDPSGVVVGTAEDMEKMAGALGKIKAALVSAYTAKSGLARERVESIMAEETWLNADEAVELGFADEVIAAMDIAATFDLSRYGKVPGASLGRATSPPTSTETPSMSKPKEPTAAAPAPQPAAVPAAAPAPAPTPVADHSDDEHRAEGATAERSRIKAILELPAKPADAEVVQAGIDNGESVDQVARKLLDRRAAREDAQHQAALKADQADPAAGVAALPTGTGETKPVERDAQELARAATTVMREAAANGEVITIDQAMTRVVAAAA
jgi:ATP-dependent Clp endopeptidase proteolytic subunit ClpP